MIVIVSTEEKARIFSSFSRLLASKAMIVVLTAYAGSLGYDRHMYVDGRTLKLSLPNGSSKYRQTDPRKSVKKLSDFWNRLVS